MKVLIKIFDHKFRAIKSDSDFGDITISKSCQSYPNRDELTFEN